MGFMDDMTKLCNSIMDEAKREAEARRNAEADVDEEMDAEEILLDTMRRMNKRLADSIDVMDTEDVAHMGESIARLYEAYSRFTEYEYDC